jgi:hypothetical protein
MAFDLVQMLNFTVGLVIPVLAGVCAVLCFVHRRLSSRLTMLGAGFLLECIVGLINRLGILALNYSTGATFGVSFGVFFFITLVGHILAFTLIVVGLALSLGDIARRTRRLERDLGEPRTHLGTEDARESWRPRTQGSQDIQP